jgi:hypothetical protein
MRLAVLLVSTLAWAFTASAEALPERMTALFKEVCVAPSTPEALMQAGREHAAAGGWTLLKSERIPAPLGDPIEDADNRPRISLFSHWQFDLPEVAGARLAITIVGPETPQVRYTVCNVEVPTVEDLTDKLTAEVERQLGSHAMRSKSFGWYRTWFLSDDGSAVDCGRTVRVPRRDSTSESSKLVFANVAALADGKWVPAFPAGCRR